MRLLPQTICSCFKRNNNKALNLKKKKIKNEFLCTFGLFDFIVVLHKLKETSCETEKLMLNKTSPSHLFIFKEDELGSNVLENGIEKEGKVVIMLFFSLPSYVISCIQPVERYRVNVARRQSAIKDLHLVSTSPVRTMQD